MLSGSVWGCSRCSLPFARIYHATNKSRTGSSIASRQFAPDFKRLFKPMQPLALLYATAAPDYYFLSYVAAVQTTQS